ncbi:hypothetical protein K7395_00080 [Streptomyces filamentosus]|uniref:Transposase n=2 Tax=Streptomyces filamentosus TaxID=67294 RepID=A0ABY4UT93_STRFL|nr:MULTISPECIES: hypothetical protein [Streptomyces]EFE79543.1 predicted protein [Streptomyces filamentosus NRRL 15998]ESU51443.1 hypothetical protein P376_0580 [Streptomyces sp. HCCB10043]EWS89741.1 hypothetical protein SSIG_07834 [Streptomyces filamentosus NRRL 11379]EWS96361.1 hypothetical protein SSIG_07794 [Streptomyces filamentosus NRRL 11379]MYR83353.1 hypothetical protein [Streptomyces sp. SID5466]
MAFFKRRKEQAAFNASLPGLGGEARRFYRALVDTHQDSARLLLAQGVESSATWSMVNTVARTHAVGVKRTAAKAGPRLDLLDPEVQRAITAGLDQFAACLGLRGSLVQAWGAAKAVNERFQAGWQPGRTALWWQETPVAFACSLQPAAEGRPVVDGLLLFDHQQFEFTPSLETQPQAGWKKSQVRKAEKVDYPRAGVLHLDPTTGWACADVANEQNAMPDDLFPEKKAKKMWGSTGQ